jgi:hypothetical protein
LNFKYRMHSRRTAKFFATDPLTKQHPWISPYAFREKNVILDIEGEELEKRLSKLPTDWVTLLIGYLEINYTAHFQMFHKKSL